jgi:uncharacterized protein YecT (DUF1311 family)
VRRARRAWLATLALALATGPAAATDMFGEGYKPCGDAGTTMATVECTAAKTKAWDQRLNAAYAALQRAADPAQREPLRRAQRLWVQYRDANCTFYAAGEGTIHRIEAAECLRAMTADRAQELEAAARP